MTYIRRTWVAQWKEEETWKRNGPDSRLSWAPIFLGIGHNRLTGIFPPKRLRTLTFLEITYTSIVGQNNNVSLFCVHHKPLIILFDNRKWMMGTLFKVSFATLLDQIITSKLTMRRYWYILYEMWRLASCLENITILF